MASTTNLTISDIVEFFPIFSALYSIYPSIFKLPAITLLPFSFLGGIDSPVIKDSSIWVVPFVITPSTANFIPGLHTKISFFFISSIVTSFTSFPTFNKA